MKKTLGIFKTVKSDSYKLMVEKVEELYRMYGYVPVSSMSSPETRTTNPQYSQLLMLTIESMLEVKLMELLTNKNLKPVNLINVDDVTHPNHIVNFNLVNNLKIDSLDNVEHTYTNLIKIDNLVYSYLIVDDRTSKFSTFHTLLENFDKIDYKQRIISINPKDKTIIVRCRVNDENIKDQYPHIQPVLRNVTIRLTSIVDHSELNLY